MKKLLLVFLSLVLVSSCITFLGCKKNGLMSNVSELRSNVFEGEISGEEKITVKCAYGFIEEPYVLDGKTGETVNRLKFKIVGDLDSKTSYSISFNYNDFNYKKEFSFSPTNNSYTAVFEIDDFLNQEFSVNIFVGAKSYPVTLKSIVPSGVLDYQDALEKLKENQPSLIAQKTDENGNFNAEIYMRILVKNEYPYWYIGISHEDGIKAFLMDAKSGKILAVREVF